MSAPATDTAARLRQAITWTAFAAGYLATYFVSTAVPTPLLWYRPLERRFTFEVHPNALAMDFIGRMLLSLAAGLLAAVVGRAIATRLPSERQAPTLRMFAAWAAGLLIFTAALYVFLLIGRTPFPLTLPQGYTPR